MTDASYRSIEYVHFIDIDLTHSDYCLDTPRIGLEDIGPFESVVFGVIHVTSIGRQQYRIDVEHLSRVD